MFYILFVVSDKPQRQKTTFRFLTKFENVIKSKIYKKKNWQKVKKHNLFVKKIGMCKDCSGLGNDRGQR